MLVAKSCICIGSFLSTRYWATELSICDGRTLDCSFNVIYICILGFTLLIVIGQWVNARIEFPDLMLALTSLTPQNYVDGAVLVFFILYLVMRFSVPQWEQYKLSICGTGREIAVSAINVTDPQFTIHKIAMINDPPSPRGLHGRDVSEKLAEKS